MNTLDLILQKTTTLPPYPVVVQKVLHLVDDPKSSAEDLVGVIQYDQALTAQILRVCNSAYFGLRRPIHSIREALVRIGFNQLLEIIMSYGSAYLFSRAYQGYDLAEGDLWRHSVASALLSQIISKHVNQEKTTVQFTAALLHDIGKIMLNEHVKENFPEIQKLVHEKNYSFIEAERAVLGTDHAEVGGKISEKWQFPQVLAFGIQYHHSPFLAPSDQELVSLIYLCDVIAMMTGFGGGADGLAYHGQKKIMKQHGLTAKDVEQIISQLEDRLHQVESLLNMGTG